MTFGPHAGYLIAFYLVYLALAFALYRKGFTRLSRNLGVAFVAFALFTGLVPCQYSGYPAVSRFVRRHLPVVSVSAQSLPECNSDVMHGGCLGNTPCDTTFFGCGWMWLGPCVCVAPPEGGGGKDV